MPENGPLWEAGQISGAPELHLQGTSPPFNDLRGLIVTPDDAIRRWAAANLTTHGIAPLITCSVAASTIALAQYKVCMVLCDESAEDGGYRAVIDIANRVDPNLPVIVISRNGDWPEYLAATSAGAFDYMAYPPLPGELRRVISQALKVHGLPHPRALMDGHSPLRAGEAL
jgi:two-component system, NtrC family, C4-dicarboxylate transport response regulator DctD